MRFKGLEDTNWVTRQAKANSIANSIAIATIGIGATSISEENKQALSLSLFTSAPAADKGSGVTNQWCYF